MTTRSATVTSEANAGAGWAALVLTVMTRGYRAFLVTLLVAALLPMLWNWSSLVVRSGSMQPAFTVGDVVVAQPFSTPDPVPVGRVMVFEAPGRHELRVHRVVEYLGHGDYVTAGDANKDVDTTPVAAEDFRAQARIQVPYIALPLIWLRGNNFVLLGGWLLLTAAAFMRASGRSPTDDQREAGGRTRGHRGRRLHWLPGPGHAHGYHHARNATSFGGLVGLVAVGVGLGSGVVPAAATFTATTRNTSNTWTVGAILQPYNEAVLADDPYVYYMVDEERGAAAADYSGHDRVGTYTAIDEYHQDGALPNNAGYSVALGGDPGRLVSGGDRIFAPTTFTLELWFRTKSTTGGKLIGFESTRDATSPTYDRHVFMAPNGTLVYGGWQAPQIRLLNSPAAYNNGEWHHLVLTTVPQGQQQRSVMYVDGAAVASGTTTKTSGYSGWWRAGYGPLPSGEGYPTTWGFSGRIDQVAVYHNQLSADRIVAHYTAR